jgi:uncharacterized protein
LIDDRTHQTIRDSAGDAAGRFIEERFMRIRLLWLPLVVVLFSAGMAAQQAPASDRAPSKEDVLKLFQILQVEQQTRAVLANTHEQVRTMTREMIMKKAPNASPDQLAQVEGMMDTMFKEYPINGILDDMVPVYQKHLTKSDLDGMIAFYSSPLGQKILREMPAMTNEAMQVSYSHIQKNMELMMKKVDDRVQSIVDEQQKKKSAPSHESKPN